MWLLFLFVNHLFKKFKTHRISTARCLSRTKTLNKSAGTRKRERNRFLLNTMGRKFVFVTSYSEEESREYTVIQLNSRKNHRNNENYLETSVSFNTGDQHVQICRYHLGARFTSYFRCVLSSSHIFKRHVWNNLLGPTPTNTIVLQILLTQPKHYPLDYRL